MDNISTEEIQKICLEILKDLDAFAKENGIRYYMSGGTLLGAVRHKGFIPWDDDIDLMMPRPDYEKFVTTYKGRYTVGESTIDRTYMTPSARVWDNDTVIEWFTLKERSIGVFIDIFPMDGYPSNEFINRIHTNRLLFTRKLLRVVIHKFREGEKKPLLKSLAQKIIKDPNKLSRKLNRIGKRYPYEGSEYVGVTTTLDHLKKERNSKDVYKETVYLPFEDMMLPAPSGYETYLRKLYGDYMQLPPPEKRVSEHNFNLYRR